MSVKFVAPQGSIKRDEDVTRYRSDEIVNLERVESIQMITHRTRCKTETNTYSIVFCFGHFSENSGRVSVSWHYPSEEARDDDFKRVMSLGDLRTLQNDDFELD